jgi:uncharacterized protein (DUF2126 family)
MLHARSMSRPPSVAQPEHSPKTPRQEEYDRAIADHDRKLAARGLEIWVGNEPTFTLRESSAPEWLSAAVGPEKIERAEQLLTLLAQAAPGFAVLRCLGRKYPGESSARFSFGLFGRRDGRPVYEGPSDPWLTTARDEPDLAKLQSALQGALAGAGFACRSFATATDLRVLFALDDRAALPTPLEDERLHRESIHAARSADETTSVHDSLADDGLFLLVLRHAGGEQAAALELPALPNVTSFCTVLARIAEAATSARLSALVLCGFPPPVDTEVSWLTVTPDPAVVEINMPPYGSVADFVAANRQTYRAAASVGLSTYRLRYNGDVADSGGGGQITFGGPSPAASPFLLVPALLPRLVRYALCHPAISYLFAHDYVGASGQSVRPDERSADVLGELRLALALLDAQPNVEPAILWQSLAPCLTDPTGNAHRAELNVEKLWNPAQPGRGQLGLVELRALRMQETPERAGALAALLRAVIAMLTERDFHEDPPDYGQVLHDRFALPFFLEADLENVLAELAACRLGLGKVLEAELRRNEFRHLASVELDGVTLSVRRALEFWPLVGDSASQQGTSRLVDASTARLELSLRATTSSAAEQLAGFELRALNRALPLYAASDARGPVRVFGLRYRCFVPSHGLHPTLGAQSPLTLLLSHPQRSEAFEITLHEWKPEGGAYDGLPSDPAEAAARRAARCVVRPVLRAELGPATPVAARALSPYSLDLRYPPPRRSEPQR